ncbi:hypothetical protein JNUCC42_13400 [Brevibacterium sp. JNUCC-42]|nr:hypothetical protein JNUCC42_13400 [Brevibacterium sp. JNUCC-42]
MVTEKISPELAEEVIEMICDADRPTGRSVVTYGEVIELSEKGKTACSEQTA